MASRVIRTCDNGHPPAHVQSGTRCAACERRRPSRQARGYDSAHTRARAVLLATLPASCAYGCGTVLRTKGEMVAAHRVDGDPSSGWVAACRSCNERAKTGWGRASDGVDTAGEGLPDPHDLVVTANGILHLPDRQLLPHDPRLFVGHSVPLAYDPDAAEPTRWLAFLADLWDDDPDSITLLQEMFGYALSGDTSLQKIMLLVWPTRAGKGVIARVLTHLLGRHNVGAPTLAGLTTNFGLQDLIGKTLAIVSDARLGPKANVQREAAGDVRPNIERPANDNGWQGDGTGPSDEASIADDRAGVDAGDDLPPPPSDDGLDVACEALRIFADDLTDESAARLKAVVDGAYGLGWGGLA